MTGGTIGHYQIVGKLGEGGMGVVYKALDTRLERYVALKVLPPGRTSDPEFKRMFAREAKAASALNHPNIVTIYGLESAAGVDFIVMEYVPGRTLHEVIGPKGLGTGEALNYAVQIADGLCAAHAAGIIHRDIKPRNVVITEKGQAKILDFGLAKLTHAPSATASATQTITGEGRITGTTGYMSPEQAEGKDLDTRSDIFSFGTVLYEMITGRQPFLHETSAETLAAVLRDAPPPLEDVPEELARLIARCLRKEPERRIQHFDDVKLVLEEIRSDEESRQSAKGQVRRVAGKHGWRRLGLLPAGILAAIAGVAGIAWFMAVDRTPARSSSVPIPLTSYLGSEVQPTFSPDGNQVAFVWDGEHQNNPDIYVKLIGGGESALRLTTDPAQDLSPAWSPDGRFIAFFRNKVGVMASVFVVSAIGGPERLVCDLGAPLAMPELPYMVVAPFPLLAWAPGGKSLIIVDHNSPMEPLGLFVVSMETGQKYRLTSAPAGYLGDGAPAVSPDGRTLIFSRAAGLTDAELYRAPLTKNLKLGSEPQRLTLSKRWNSTPVWLPGGREFAFTTSNWYLRSGTLQRMAASSSGPPLAFGGVEEDIAWPAVSAQRRRLIFSRVISTKNIWRLPLRNGAAAGPAEKLIASTRTEEAPQYSPDGRKIVFTSSRSGAPEVWVCEKDGSNPVQLTFLGAAVTGSPHWSPDGEQIVFDSNADGHFDVYGINAAGGSPRLLTAHVANDALASFSGDNRNIYFSSDRTGRWEVWKMPAKGGNATQVTFGGGRAAIESPDGKTVYYERDYELWSLPAKGGEETRLLDSVGFLNFAVAQKGIYFLASEEVDPRHTVQFFIPAARKTNPLFEIGAAVGAGFTVDPENRSLLYTKVDQRGSDLMLVENFR